LINSSAQNHTRGAENATFYTTIETTDSLSIWWAGRKLTCADTPQAVGKLSVACGAWRGVVLSDAPR
jgi:hypothetical protein